MAPCTSTIAKPRKAHVQRSCDALLCRRTLTQSSSSTLVLLANLCDSSKFKPFIVARTGIPRLAPGGGPTVEPGSAQQAIGKKASSTPPSQDRVGDSHVA